MPNRLRRLWKQTPGLSNGIFMGKGDYNQDLSPRVTLIEVGSHTNSKDEAEKGAKLFASTIPVVLGVPVEGRKLPLNLTGGSGGWDCHINNTGGVGAAAAGYYSSTRSAAEVDGQIFIVIACGGDWILARWIMLRSDYRHYPTYPHRQLIHLALGFIAASWERWLFLP